MRGYPIHKRLEKIQCSSEKLQHIFTMDEAFTELVEWAGDVARRGKPVLIDGWMSAGKSTLARALATAVHGQMLDADEYLIRNQDAFIAALDTIALQEAFFNAERPILAGVCMRQIHALLGSPHASHVYVKRMASWGWADEDDVILDVSDCSNKEQARTPSLVLEVRAYHGLWHPHETADFIYERVEIWDV